MVQLMLMAKSVALRARLEQTGERTLLIADHVLEGQNAEVGSASNPHIKHSDISERTACA